MSALSPSAEPMSESASADFLVICLCAEWCGTCRDYRPGFTGLAAQFPGVRFRWLDIEEEADELGDLDVENFPTLFISRGEQVLFYGTMLPYLNHLQRTLETFCAQTPGESYDYAQANEERQLWQADPDLQHLGRLGD